MIINTCEKEQEIAKRRQQRKNKMTKEEKALEKDYKRYCEIVGDLSSEELNRRYKKNYLLQGDKNKIQTFKKK